MYSINNHKSKYKKPKEQLIWPSPAKINLFLYIIGQRKDKYHKIQTLLQFLDYGDEIKIIQRKDNIINIIGTLPNISKKNNLIYKAAYLLKKYYKKIQNNKSLGANIYIKKRLQIGGGLGGGSSNAATTLIGLNYIWKTNLKNNILIKLSHNLGADVPFFVNGRTSFAEGIGNKLHNINLKQKWYLIICPKIVVSTKSIFSDRMLKIKSKKRNFKKLLKQKYTNDLEEIIKKRYPKIKQLFLWLLKYTTPHITGTGGCIFGEFKTKKEASKILYNAPKWTKGFIAKSSNYSSLFKFQKSLSKRNQNS